MHYVFCINVLDWAIVQRQTWPTCRLPRLERLLVVLNRSICAVGVWQVANFVKAWIFCPGMYTTVFLKSEWASSLTSPFPVSLNYSIHESQLLFHGHLHPGSRAHSFIEAFFFFFLFTSRFQSAHIQVCCNRPHTIYGKICATAIYGSSSRGRSSSVLLIVCQDGFPPYETGFEKPKRGSTTTLHSYFIISLTINVFILYIYVSFCYFFLFRHLYLT